MLPTANYRPWRIRVEEFPASGTLQEQLKFLIGYAILAPSSHNAQPWQFKITDDAILVSPNRARAVPLADPDERLLHIALGGAIENLLIAADYFSFATTVDYFPIGTDAVARIIFAKKNTQPNANHLIFSISKRHTHRGKYSGRVPADFVAWMATLTTSTTRVDVIDDEPRRHQLAEIINEARVTEMDDAPFRREMARYKRNNFSLSGVGITGNTMGFSWLKSLVAPFALRRFNVLNLTKKEDEEMLKHFTPALVVVSTASDDKQAWLTTGQIFERIALSAERAGLRTNVSVAAVTFGDYYRKLQSVIGATLRPQIVFRLGGAGDVWPHSPRLSVSHVLTS